MKEGDEYVKQDPNDHVFGNAAPIVERERKHLEVWRGSPPQVGLALSGGGIRSASFNLGVLQALAHEHCLPNIDYLSTVSGGGYIGASMTYLLHESTKLAGSEEEPEFNTSREAFPYISFPMVGVKAPGQDRLSSTSNAEKGRLLRRLRQSASYLAPGNGVTFLSFAGVLMRNLVASAVVHFSIVVIMFQLLFDFEVFHAHPSREPDGYGEMTGATGSWNALLTSSLALLGAYLLLSTVYVFLTGFIDGHEHREHERGNRPGHGPYRLRRLLDVSATWVLLIVLATFIVGAMPALYRVLTDYNLLSLDEWAKLLGQGGSDKPAVFGVIATVIGLLGNLWALLRTRSPSKPSVPTGVIVALASSILLLGVALLAYVFTHWLDHRQVESTHVWLALATVLFLLGWRPNTNYVSLHRFYRDRLMELFLPDLGAVRSSVSRDGGTGADASIGKSLPGDAVMLGDLCGAGSVPLDVAVPHTTQVATSFGGPDGPPGARPQDPRRLRGPYHLINANVVLVASGHPRYRGRGGDNFILSPLFSGSHATGWTRTTTQAGEGLTVATAMAISGAAVSPNAASGGEGFTRQPMLSVLMGLLNLRLGYWHPNPNPTLSTWSTWSMRLFGRQPNMLVPALSESFNRATLHERSAHVLLTDGGHFENLGLYELVRRRLRLIVLCDATEDPEFKFVDLANAVEKVRADFGAIIHITSKDLQGLVPRKRPSEARDRGTPPMADRSHLVARIEYAPAVKGEHVRTVPMTGTLIYLKATLFKEMVADLHGYACAHADFPDQSSGDQFFDERQFEAYRELGYQATWHMLRQLLNDQPHLRSQDEFENLGLLCGKT